MKLLAANGRDPVAIVVFGLLGTLAELRLIPPDTDPNTVLAGVCYAMAGLAMIFTWLHHKDFKKAYAVGLEVLARNGAPTAISDAETPIEDPPDAA